MKFSTLHIITLGTAMLLTACESGETGTTELGDALDTLAAEAEQEALRRHGVDAADAEGEGEDEALGEPGEEAPQPGERIAAFCAERSAEVLARCEERRANAAEEAADAPACDVVAEAAERHCVRRAVRHIRGRLHQHAETCRDEARTAVQACVDAGGDRETCRETALEGARACLEAAPDRPEGDRPEGERPEGERPRGDRPVRGDADDEGAEDEGAEDEGAEGEDEDEDDGDEG